MINLFFLIILLFHLTFSQVYSLNKNLEKAKVLFKNQDYKKLISYLLLWNEKEHTYESLFLLGLSFLYSKNYIQSLKELNKSYTIFKKSIDHKDPIYVKKKKEILFYLSIAYKKNNQLDLSLEISLKLLKEDKKNFVLLSNIGFLFFKQKNYKKAKYYYQKSYDLNPNFQGALSGLAKVYSKFDTINKAISFYKKLIEINPKYVSYYMEIANLFLKKKDIYSYNYYLTKAHYLSQQYTYAIDTFYKTKAGRKNIDLYQILISSLIELKQFDKAKREF